jgi:hypothetical protein
MTGKITPGRTSRLMKEEEGVESSERQFKHGRLLFFAP